MPLDSAATKKRLLDAAFREFAQHGLAGARIDRIGEAAEANKRLIYVYFGNKEQLFDTVVQYSIDWAAEAVPFTVEDLPGYAGRMFDTLLAHPEHMRLAAWAQLERPAVTASEVAAYRVKTDAITQARIDSVLPAGPEPADLLALTLSVATAWLGASPGLRELGSSDAFSPDRLARHRVLLLNAVDALIALPAADDFRA